MNSLCRALLASALAFPLAAQSQAAERTQPWPASVVEQFETLPVQEQGRVKPLSTLASWMLFRMNERRWVDVPGGDKLSPMEWFLDSLFFPEQARNYRTFRVTDSAALDAIGLSDIIRRKADRYSYNELWPGAARLEQLAGEYHKLNAKTLTPVQGQIVDLYGSVIEYYVVLGYLDFARQAFVLPASKGLAKTFPGQDAVAFHQILEHAPALMGVWRALAKDPGAAGVDPAVAETEKSALEQLLTQFGHAAESGRQLALLPPLANAPPESPWRTVSEIAEGAMMGAPVAEQYPPMIAALEQMVLYRDDPQRFTQASEDFHQRTTDIAAARGEYDKIGLEVTYYNADFFFKAQWTYVLSFLVIALSWLRPHGRWLPRLGGGVVMLATGVLVAGIATRCILRGRPPISNLYETTLFITAVAVTVAMVIEWINKRRIALPLAAFIGMAGMFLATRYEIIDPRDSMPRLRAVLDTNFWLATHVTAVTTGYAAGLLSGVIAHVYILGRLFGFRSGDRTFYKNLARMVYGVLCFGLFFAVVGTILGGVWANDSWGRFWGWDPKENGALMICLWQIMMIHGRMGGYLRDLGLCIFAVLGTMVVAFSWWHVNQLGVGLHSYGFTQGVVSNLFLFYGFEGVIVALGGVVHLLSRNAAPRAT